MSENKGGRPLKFKTAKELQAKIEEYFNSCYEEVWIESENGWIPVLDRNGNIRTQQIRPFTITGLAVHLDTTRETLLDYAGKEEYSDTIKHAKARIENYTEEQLFDKTARNMTGIIFNLKNNYKTWVDKQEVDSTIGNKDGKPFETNLSQLSIEELKQLAKTKPGTN